MVAYFESKRNAVNENQNNGLIMLTEDEEQLSIFLDIIPPELTLKTVKGFGLLDLICELDETHRLDGNETCYSSRVHVRKDKRDERVLSKSRAELLLKALEVGLQVNDPGYESFVQPFCVPSDGSKIQSVKLKSKQVETMYDMEIFIASELKAQHVEVFLEGFYCPKSKDPRPKSDVVAHKFCHALVESGNDLETMKDKFAKNPLFIPNLPKMPEAQRLKCLYQTNACLNFVKRYFDLAKMK